MSEGRLHLPFPTSFFPGEALFSYLGRLLRAGGYAYASEFAALATGKHGRRVSLSLPCHLTWLGDNVSGLQEYTCEQLVGTFTAAPLFRPFLNEQEWLAVAAALSSQGSREARMLLGLARGGGEQTVPLHCTACMEEQAESYGVPYWPLKFVLPYVTACPKHKLKLQAVPPASNIRLGRKYTYFGAPRCTEGTPICAASESELRLSALAIELHEAHLKAMDSVKLASAYRRRLQQEGLVVGETRIRRSQVQARLDNAWAGLELPIALREHRWLHDMYLPAGCRRRSPLHHLLFIGAFFADVSDWVTAVSTSSDTHEKSHSPRYVGTRRVQLQPWLQEGPVMSSIGLDWSETERHLLAEGHSVREVAAAGGRSRFSVYRRLQRDPRMARTWAQAALAKEAERRSIDPGNPSASDRPRCDNRWLRRHKDALHLLAPECGSVKGK